MLPKLRFSKPIVAATPPGSTNIGPAQLQTQQSRPELHQILCRFMAVVVSSTFSKCLRLGVPIHENPVKSFGALIFLSMLFGDFLAFVLQGISLLFCCKEFPCFFERFCLLSQGFWGFGREKKGLLFWVVARKKKIRAFLNSGVLKPGCFKPGCLQFLCGSALLGSFELVCGLAFALFCALLRRVSAPDRVWELQRERERDKRSTCLLPNLMDTPSMGLVMDFGVWSLWWILKATFDKIHSGKF